MRRWLTISLMLVLLTPLPLRAVEPSEMLADPALEARARALSAELRCLVCQNQSIDDSNAPLAKDLRVIVRERLKAGDTDAQAMQYLVARYGDFILLKPPLNSGTLLLWATPFGVLLVGGLFLLWNAKRRSAAIPTAQLSKEEAAKLESILGHKEAS